MLKIKDDTLFTITNISFSDSAQKFLKSLPKADFEEIIYDRTEDSFYISIEGNGKDFKRDIGIYKIEFEGSNIESLLITSIKKMNFNPLRRIFAVYKIVILDMKVLQLMTIIFIWV